MASVYLKQSLCGTSESTSANHSEIHLEICHLNFYCAVFHCSFLVVLILTFGLACIHRKKHGLTNSLFMKFPYHNMRWLFSSLLLMLQIVAITEGILTDHTGNRKTRPSFVYLYIPAICAFSTAGWATILSHCVEVWQRKWPSFVLATYWTLSCGLEIGRLVNLRNANLARCNIFCFDIGVGLLVTYGTLAAIEMHNIYKMVRLRIAFQFQDQFQFY